MLFHQSMRYLLLIFVCSNGINSFAQDTIKRRSVDITSTFKPTLKEAAKINLNASPATVDTTRPRLLYNIPNQNLNFAYQPGMLRPLALAIDTGGIWDNWNYVKLGYGSLKNPYLETGLSLGNGNTAGVNLYGFHTNSKGKIKFQNYKTTNIDVTGFLQTSKHLEWNGRVGAKEENFNKYGFEPKTLEIDEDSLEVKLQTFTTRLSFRNINRTAFGLSYAPEAELNLFKDRLNNTESNTHIHLPLNKTIGNIFEVAVALTADFTRYSPDSKDAITNNYFVFSPSIFYKKSNINIQAGIKPSWDSEGFKLFPNIMAELSSVDRQFTIQAGWIGHLRKNSYHYLTSLNPWIWAPETITTSSIQEIYGGVKGSVTDHLTYSAKIGFNNYTNQPLFVNDTSSGKSFMVVTEPSMKAINVSGEVGYNVGERFSMLTGLTVNRYMNLKENSNPWGLIPLELRTAIRIQVLKDLYVKGDMYAFSTPWYLSEDGSKRGKGAMDLSAGLEFAVVKNVKVWAQFNNLMSNEYERWHQYPVYGFNFLGGVVLSIEQKNK
ncbi:MAG: hypothetical protein ABR502_10495 [Chitinophagaceae bacterium]